MYIVIKKYMLLPWITLIQFKIKNFLEKYMLRSGKVCVAASELFGA